MTSSAAPCSVSNILLFPGIALAAGKVNNSKKCYLSRTSSKHTLSFHRFALPPPSSVSLFSPYKRSSLLRRLPTLSATGTDVAVDESETPVVDENSTNGEVSSSKVAPGSSLAPARRSRIARKSDMPPVKNEDLVIGTTFTGKVKSIQPFGAFVDIGAFTEGLVHVSRLSEGYVKDVGSIVAIGQEVKVRVVEVNFEKNRIGLSMREEDDGSRPTQQKDASGGPSPARKGPPRSGPKKTSKFDLGENLVGTVKNLTKSGAFILLPGEEEGFLPRSEESSEGFASVLGESSLVVGKEIKVRVLGSSRGKVTLTMKDESTDQRTDSKTDQELAQSEDLVRTNAFMLAFRKNKDIAMFLDERDKQEKITVDETVVDEVSSKEASLIADGAELSIEKEEEASSEILSPEGTVGTTMEADVENPESIASSLSPAVDSAELSIEKEEEVSSEILAPEASVSVTDEIIEEASPKDEVESEKKSESSEDTNDEVVSSEGTIAQVEEAQADSAESKDEVDIEAPTTENEVPAIEPVQEELTSLPDVNSNPTGSDGQPPQETKASISPAIVKQLREETGAGMMDCKNALLETEGDIAKAQEFLRKKGLASADKKASRATAEGRIGSYIHDGRIGVLVEVNCETDFVSRGDIFKELVDDLAMQVAACPQVSYVDTEDVPEEIVNKEKDLEMQKEDLLSKPEQMRSRIVEGRIRKRLEELALLEQPYIKSDKVVVKDWVKQTIATVGENMKVKRFVRFNLGEGLEKKSQDFAAEVAAQTAAKSDPVPEKEQPTPVEAEAKDTVETRPASVAISAAVVKQLREETGAGMMDCKKALSETGGDLEKAQEYLRKKGLSSADKKSSRLAAEGRIGSYIHDSRIGVLIEVNCETDFVGRSEKFKELVDDLAMQVVASPLVQYVSIEDIPEGIVQKEKELEMQRDDLQSKPENIREKIVEGRVLKRLGALALVEQPFIKDDSVLVKDLVKQTIAAIGENIKVRRFVRFTLGETN